MVRAASSPDVKLTNAHKVFFPSGYTKGEMVRYYLEVAPYILPHLRDRPVTLIRFPDGVKGGSFYEKNAPKFTPSWVQTFKVARGRGGHINYILVNDAETLAWCANLAAIEFHPFLHTAPKIDCPTHVAFDLDPGEGADIFTCAEVAFRLKGLFDSLGLQSFPKVSGSKGIQIYVPLNTPVSYDVTTPFAKSVAELLAQQEPDLVVSAMPKAIRKNRVLIDWSQNNRSKTTVSVYSMRAKRDEPFVSMPFTWDELRRAARRGDRATLDFTPAEALRRLKKVGDRFAPVLELKQRLPEQFMQLDAAAPRKPRALEPYARKRDFSKTREPIPEVPAQSTATAPRFVIQKHAARRLHYDFRLEMDGTLKSWAVPKGPPYEPGTKHAAFEVEDHPLDYMQFEGTIPAGQYGGGTVMVWDIGTYELLGGNWDKGDLKLRLHGKKLKGEWHIFRIRGEENKPVWLLTKSKPGVKPISAKRDDSSALTGRSMKRIAQDNDAQWNSDRDGTANAVATTRGSKTSLATAPARPRTRARSSARPRQSNTTDRSRPRSSGKSRRPKRGSRSRTTSDATRKRSVTRRHTVGRRAR